LPAAGCLFPHFTDYLSGKKSKLMIMMMKMHIGYAAANKRERERLASQI